MSLESQKGLTTTHLYTVISFFQNLCLLERGIKSMLTPHDSWHHIGSSRIQTCMLVPSSTTKLTKYNTARMCATIRLGLLFYCNSHWYTRESLKLEKLNIETSHFYSANKSLHTYQFTIHSKYRHFKSIQNIKFAYISFYGQLSWSFHLEHKLWNYNNTVNCHKPIQNDSVIAYIQPSITPDENVSSTFR